MTDPKFGAGNIQIMHETNLLCQKATKALIISGLKKQKPIKGLSLVKDGKI